MKKFRFHTGFALFLFTIGCIGSLFVFSSYRLQNRAGDFLQQLGISRDAANEKITNSILGGYISSYGAKSAKNIALGNRKAVTLDLLAYVKQFVGGGEFAKNYNEMRERYKPEKPSIQTPEEVRAQNIANSKKFVIDAEEMVKKADASFKAVFEKNLADAKQNLRDAEDPKNKQYVAYKQNYPQLAKDLNAGYERSLAQWNQQYPGNQLLFVKRRLEQFLELTKDVDFSAALTERNGKKIFANAEYEHKDGRWKMAFRVGREVVEPARAFVQKWIEEIK